MITRHLNLVIAISGLLLLTVSGCGSSENPTAQTPQQAQGTLPMVARAPEGAAKPVQAPAAEPAPEAVDEPAPEISPPVTEPANEEGQPNVDPLDGRPLDEAENFEPQPLPEDRSPFDTDDFPRPGALSEQPTDDAGIPAVDPPAAPVEVAVPPVVADNPPPQGGAALPPGLEHVSPQWIAANRAFFQQVGALLRGLKQRQQPLPRSTEEFVALLDQRHIDMPSAPPGKRLVYDPNQGEVGGLLFDTNPAAEEGPADLVKAEVGLGDKGHYESQNIMSVAVSARFRAEERILLGQINQALQMFRATHGRKPKDHEEFIKKVVAENGYRLPELPEGQSYYYDPSRGPDGELMVRIPKR